VEELIQLDKELFLFLNGLGTPSWDGFWLYLSQKVSLITIPLYISLFLFSYRIFGIKKTGLLLVFVGLTILTTDQMANFFKYGVGRFRPCHDETISGAMRLVKSYCGGKYGYFSAHAANSFALATFFIILFGKRLKWFAVLLLVWALLVGYSRIYIGVHFPLDVITGVFIGAFLGWLYARLFIFATLKWSI